MIDAFILTSQDKFLNVEGMDGKKVYLIMSGTCVVYQTHEFIDRAGKVLLKRLPMCRISEGSILGEECLFEPFQYNYSIKVESSLCRVLVFKRSSNMQEFKRNGILADLHKIYQKKE